MATIILFAPLIGALICGFGWRLIGEKAGQVITTALVFLGAALSWYIFLTFGGETQQITILRWIESGTLGSEWSIRLDRLTAIMLVVVNTVSALVHLYSFGYMAHDENWHEGEHYKARFFAYLSFFTFAMLALVTSDNLVQMFFGWEGVGVASYLLIGFYYRKPSANAAAIKAFVVNRVGDFGFALGIFALYYLTDSIRFDDVFAAAPTLAETNLRFLWADWNAANLVGVLLFIGAMGKSAQLILHTWLPDAMEGPTPVSALIHAATMVTAGVFLVCRMSPLYEYAPQATAFITVLGATTAFFAATIGLVQNDIKRVIAYSTCSQLGYMFVGLGIGGYSLGIFHLFTHAFFKALLFLGAGSVIHAMHHEQDMRYMGGLAKRMPITCITMWLGSLALVAAPGFAGFFSKDAIIEAVAESHRAFSGYAYFCVMAGVFVTSLYSFRLLYMTFHGKERFVVEQGGHGHHHHHEPGHLDHPPRESPWVVTVPLILLAIPSVVIGWNTVGPALFGGWFGGSIQVLPRNDVLAELAHGFHGPLASVLHGFTQWPFWISLAGFVVATWIWLYQPSIADKAAKALRPLYNMLVNKYWVDDLYRALFVGGGQALGRGLWKGGDAAVIDGAINGSSALVDRTAGVVRWVQSGYLYHYAFAMILGLILLLGGLWWTLAHAVA